MLWVLVDVLLVLIALAVLGAILWGLWGTVKDLGGEVARAGDAIGAATDKLAELQAERPELFPADEPSVSTASQRHH